tara:strand:- start:1008 stop:1967 length:960 start_codon:yes stop_codon:yes gene_type:complete
MDKYERNIKIKRVLTTLDTNNDGVEDTIAYLNQEDLYLPFLLKQSIKDLGVYTDYEEEEEVIDLGGFWDTSNSGYGDAGTSPISGGIINPYGDGVDSPEVISIDGVDIIYGCMDETDPNYNPNATVDDGSCLSSQDFDTGVTVEDNSTEPSGSGQSGPAGCYKLSTGCISDEGYPVSSTKFYDWVTTARDWCQGESNDYPRTNDCIPNGCGSQYDSTSSPTCAEYSEPSPCPCQPAPSTHSIPYIFAGGVTNSLYPFCSNNPNVCYSPDPYDPNSAQCDCVGDNELPGIPELIFNIQRTNVGCPSGEYNYTYQFFCMAN